LSRFCKNSLSIARRRSTKNFRDEKFQSRILAEHATVDYVGRFRFGLFAMTLVDLDRTLNAEADIW